MILLHTPSTATAPRSPPRQKQTNLAVHAKARNGARIARTLGGAICFWAPACVYHHAAGAILLPTIQCSVLPGVRKCVMRLSTTDSSLFGRGEPRLSPQHRSSKAPYNRHTAPTPPYQGGGGGTNGGDRNNKRGIGQRKTTQGRVSTTAEHVTHAVEGQRKRERRERNNIQLDKTRRAPPAAIHTLANLSTKTKKGVQTAYRRGHLPYLQQCLREHVQYMLGVSF